MIRESQPCPVTGEILAADHERPVRGSADKRADIEDAVFETLGPDADPRPASAAMDKPETNTARPHAADSQAASLNVLRGERAHALSGLGHHFRQTGGPLFWGLAVVLVASAFWISGGHALVTRQSGATDGPALVISGVQSRFDTSQATAFLLVEATVENRDTSGHRLPPVIVNIAQGDGTSHQFRLPARADNLSPGARHLFSGRVPAPKNGLDSVSVSLGSGDDQ